MKDISIFQTCLIKIIDFCKRYFKNLSSLFFKPIKNTVENILSIFQKHRRILSGEDLSQFSDTIKNTLSNFIENGCPIEVVLPAFPDKSIVRDKTSIE